MGFKGYGVFDAVIWIKNKYHKHIIIEIVRILLNSGANIKIHKETLNYVLFCNRMNIKMKTNPNNFPGFVPL